MIFIAGEGANGLYLRTEALCQAREIDIETVDRVRVLPGPVNFYSGDTTSLTKAVDGLDEPPVLFVIDTVARCMVGGDENSARDMGLFIQHVDDVRRRYSAAALVIHHTGKSGDLERGSSALRAAADTLSLLKPDGSGLKLSCEKQKDSAPFKPWNLHLAEAGQSVSLEVGTVSGELSPQELQILEAVSASFGTDWVSTSKVKEVADVPSSSIYRGLKSLVQAEKLEDREAGKQRREYRVPPADQTTVPTVPNAPTGHAQNQPNQPHSLKSGLVGEGEGLVDDFDEGKL